MSIKESIRKSKIKKDFANSFGPNVAQFIGPFIDSLVKRLDELHDEVTPVKGVDYFTEKEMRDFLAKATPIKGHHYFDGVKGDPGKDGHDPDENVIIKKVVDIVLARIKTPQDGKPGEHGRDGKDIDREEVMREVREMVHKLFAGKKMNIKDVEGLEGEIAGVRSRRHGGQGKTYVHLVGTDVQTSDNQTYSFVRPPLESELFVIRGGAWVFKENGDYAVTAFPGGRVKSIVLTLPLDVANGETINFRSKG